MANSALIDELERQFRDNPRRVFARLANEYRKSGEVERALEICYAHVPQQPGYISGHIVLGQTLFDAGEMETARQTFETALTLDPENLIALRQLGDIARLNNDIEAAKGWYSRLLDVDPQNDDVVAQLGELALAENSAADRPPPAPAESESSERVDESAAVALEEQPEGESTSYESAATAEPSAHTADVSPTGNSAPIQGLQGNTPQGDEGLLDFDEIEPLDERDDVAESDQAFSMPDEDAETGDQAAELTWLDSEPAEQLSATPAPAPDSDSDLDFGFISQDEDEPLSLTITGEHLSVVSEEDPLAGVTPRQSGSTSPFGIAPSPRVPDDADASTPAGQPEQGSGDQPGEEPRDSGTQDHAAMSDDMAFELGEAETLISTTGDFGLENWTDSDESRVDDSTPEGLLTNDGSDTMPAATAEGLVPTEDVPMYEDPSALDAESGSENPDESSSASAGAAADSGASLEDFRFAPVEEDFPDDQASVTAEWRAQNEPELEEAGPEDADEVVERPSATFVTETMAELYLRQGYNERALDVYRQLALQQPDDERIRAKIAELQGSRSEQVTGRESGAGAETAAGFFGGLASRKAAPGEAATQAGSQPESTEPSSPEELGDWADTVLSNAGEVDVADDAAAAALSSGFSQSGAQAPATINGTPAHAAAQELSLDEIFGAERNSEGSRGASASLDAFFTPEGERADSGDHSAEGRPDADDLEAFSAWLEGLKK